LISGIVRVLKSGCRRRHLQPGLSDHARVPSGTELRRQRCPTCGGYTGRRCGRGFWATNQLNLSAPIRSRPTLRGQPSYFPAQNCATLAFGENHPVGGKLQDRTELNLTSAAAVDSFL
jgi:hypothetical protein